MYVVKASVNSKLIIGLACVAIFVAVAGVHHFIRNGSHSVLSATDENISPSVQPGQTAVYQDGEFSFSYDASWTKISSNALFSLNFDSSIPVGKGEIEYLYTPTQWRQVKDLMNKLKDEGKVDPTTGRLPITATANAVMPYMEINIHRREGRSAKEVAIESTKAICTGKLAPYNKNDPADPSKIKETVVVGLKVYVELPQSTCDYQFVTIYFDSTKKNADGKVDSFQIIFRDASDLEHLSPEQKIILNSIKVE